MGCATVVAVLLPVGSYAGSPVRKSDVVPGTTRASGVVTRDQAGTQADASSRQTLTTTLNLTAADNGRVFDHYTISTAGGANEDCVYMDNVSNVTFTNSQIGPCTGHAFEISGGSNIGIFDSYIHTEHHPTAQDCCDLNHGVYAYGGTAGLVVQGNVIAFNESNIRVQGTGSVMVQGNFLLNPLGPFPRGQNFQSDTVQAPHVVGNYTYASTSAKFPFKANQEDSINFYNTTSAVATGNFVFGGTSNSGCGMIVDAGSTTATFQNNTFYDSGQCGIGVSTGVGSLIKDNRVLDLTPIAGGGNSGIYVANYNGSACHSNTLTGNVSAQLQQMPCNPKTQSCYFSGYYADGSCTGTKLTGNTFDVDQEPIGGGPAYKSLVTTVPSSAPLIPPGPKNCVARSPYSTQTSKPPC